MRAFTLVELLVVVTIIVVLLALLTPALDSAIRQSERAACGSQLHAQDVACKQYAVDQKRDYPLRVRPEHWPDGGMVWIDNINPAGQAMLFFKQYLADPDMFYCPGHEGPDFSRDLHWDPSEVHTDGNRWILKWINYPYWGGDFTSTSDPSNTLKPLLARSIRSPGNRILITDDITIDKGSLRRDQTRNHGSEGPEYTQYDDEKLPNPPAGGNLLTNDGGTVWMDFREAELRLRHPVGAGHQRDWYF